MARFGGGFRRYYPETNMASESMFPSYSAWGGYGGGGRREQSPYSVWGAGRSPAGRESAFTPDWGYDPEGGGILGAGFPGYGEEPEKGREPLREQRDPAVLDPRGPTPGGKKKDGGDTIININTNGGVRHEADQPLDEFGNGKGGGRGGFDDYPVRHFADEPFPPAVPPTEAGPSWYDPLRAWYQANYPQHPYVGMMGQGTPETGGMSMALRKALAGGYSPFYGVDPEQHQGFRNIFETYQKALPRIGTWDNLYAMLRGELPGLRERYNLPVSPYSELYRKWLMGGESGTPDGRNEFDPIRHFADQPL